MTRRARCKMGNSTSSAHQFDNIVTERIPQRKGTAPAPQRNGPSAGRGRKLGYYQSTGAVPMLEPTRTENVPQRPPGRAQKS
jgi:hypothetical protein